MYHPPNHPKHKGASFMSFKHKDKLINESETPVLATFAAAFLEKSEQNIRQAARARGKSYKTLSSASNHGLSMKFIRPCFTKALNEAVMVACGADVEGYDNRLREENLKENLKQYLQVA